MNNTIINVVLAIDFSDEIIDRLRRVSPRLNIERHFPTVPEGVWARADVVYTTSIVPEPQQAPNLKWIQLNSAGMEHVMHKPIITETDVQLTSASGIHAVPMAEYAMGLMLAWEYRLMTVFAHQQRKHWEHDRDAVFAPRHLRGQTLGIVGYGSIGRELARLAKGIGMLVLAVKRDAKHPKEGRGYAEIGTGDNTGDLPERIYPPQAVASMARDCDYVVLLTPLTEQSRGMIGADVFAVMRSHGVLINLARGPVVDTPAMVDALQQQTIGGAILDVFDEEPLPTDSPLWTMPNVIVSPHIAGNSSRYHERAASLFAENLQRYVEGEPLLNTLDRNRGY